MVNDMYILDLSTLEWTRHLDPKGEESMNYASTSEIKLPQPRYFHSCDLWNDKLIIFGGMGYEQGNDSELCVLNEVVAFDLATQKWDLEFGNSLGTQGDGERPEPRYAHLSSVTANSLVVVGGQDMANHYIEAINVFDLGQRKWTISQDFGKQRGSYRSLAVGRTWSVNDRLSGQSQETTHQSSSSSSSLHQNNQTSSLSTSNITPLPTSKKSWDDQGKEKRLPIYVYTNYNFTDVKREMEVVNFEDGQVNKESNDTEEDHITIEDQSGSMTGISLPPGLRFPMGAMLGNYMLISGTYLANTSQTFAIWALHLPKMTWSRLDVGPLLSTGSWNRGVLWPKQSRLLIFGHRDRDLVSDYNHRQTNWDHVLILELEAWGITQAPIETVSHASVKFGLQKLASSVLGSLSHSLPSQMREEDGEIVKNFALGGRGDFEIVCSDGMRLGCDRAILESRWPWFASKMKAYRQEVRQKAQQLYKGRSNGSQQDEQVITLLSAEEEATKSSDPRITPRQLMIGEPSPVMLALLIFFYTQCICTSIQRHPAIVASLLIISKVYDMKDLEMWAKHAAHVSLATDLSPPANEIGTPTSASPASPAPLHYSLPPLERHRLAVALYEAATMCGFEALQIRSLRTVMSIAKWVQRSSLLSNRSSTVLVDSSGGEMAQTPTTSTLYPEGAANSPLADTRMVTSPIRAPSTTTSTSPASSKRLSIGRGGASETVHDSEETLSNVARRPSKAERMLGMSGADVVASKFGGNTASLGRSEKMVGPSSYPEAARASSLGQIQRTPSQSTTSNSSSSNPAPSLGQIRRPSAPVMSASSMVNARNPSGDHPPTTHSSVGRKRFSIFGRANTDSAKSPVLDNHGHSGGIDSTLDEVRSSSEHGQQNPSLHRTNTNGTADESSSRSLNSSTHPTSSENLSLSTSGASLPPPGFSEKEMRKIERESGKGKMTTLTRLKASALKTIDTSHSLHNNSNNNNNGSTTSSNKPTSAASATGSSNVMIQPSSHKNSESGKLSDKELKALYSIWS